MFPTLYLLVESGLSPNASLGRQASLSLSGPGGNRSRVGRSFFLNAEKMDELQWRTLNGAIH